MVCVISGGLVLRRRSSVRGDGGRGMDSLRAGGGVGMDGVVVVVVVVAAVGVISSVH